MHSSLKPISPKTSELDRWQRIGLTVLVCGITTVMAYSVSETLDMVNVVMIFMLTVLWVAVKLGREPAIWASVLNVMCFDIFFVPPQFSLAVSDLEYLITFAVMLITGLTVTHYTSSLQNRAKEAQQRENRTQALYQLAKALAGALQRQQAIDCCAHMIGQQLAASVQILTPQMKDTQLQAHNHPLSCEVDLTVAQMAFEQGHRIYNPELQDLGLASLYIPLQASMRLRGVLAIRIDRSIGLDQHNHDLLDAVASLLAVALERLHYVEVAQAAELDIQTERLRNRLLSALSHDLRTPLTAMVGLADSLFLIKPPLPTIALETAQTLHEQADRLCNLVSNLLDMARLSSGSIALRREWQPLEEVIGASLKLLTPSLGSQRVDVYLPKDLPWVEIDSVLMERVLCNLLENAAKYGHSERPIEIRAHTDGQTLSLEVLDFGAGFPKDTLPHVFEPFVRGSNQAGTPGTGLGLAICRLIVEAHGGALAAQNRHDQGAVVCVTLPLGNPPLIEDEEVQS